MAPQFPPPLSYQQNLLSPITLTVYIKKLMYGLKKGTNSGFTRLALSERSGDSWSELSWGLYGVDQRFIDAVACPPNT